MQLESRRADDTTPLVGSGRKSLLGTIATYFMMAALIVVIVILSVIAARVYNDSDESCSRQSDPCPAFAKPVSPTFAPHAPLVLQNALIFFGNGSKLGGGSVLVENGRISAVGTTVPVPPNATVIDVGGAPVTPGIVDMHNHAGVYPFPIDLEATQDGNEMTNPDFPSVRVVDAIDPSDPALGWIRKGGLTTLLILPGSGNVMGGEGQLIKLRNSKTVGGLLIQGAPRQLKMAMGENPKRVYGLHDVTPMSRMGIAWELRNMFQNAAALKAQQDDWCACGKGPMPQDISLDPLVALLRGQARLNVHCYEVRDFEAMLRVADEFGFRVSAFHHALEAWVAPELFRERNITIATFVDLWGYKWEAFHATVYAPAILEQAGVRVSLKSDHPVIDAHFLVWTAAIANYYGLSEEAAIAALTSVPAQAVGLGDRVGLITPGYEGDLVVWDRHPLLLGAQPTHVFIEGIQVESHSLPLGPTILQRNTATLDTTGVNACTSSASYAVVNVTVWDMQGASPVGIANANIIVQNGQVTCVGVAASCPVPAGSAVYRLNGGVVIPGIIESDAALGLNDIDQEPAAQDGVGGGLPNTVPVPDAEDALRLTQTHVFATFHGGTTVAVSAPLGPALVRGISAAVELGGALVNSALLKRNVALHVEVDQRVKYTGAASISSQIAFLRAALESGASPFDQVLNGSLPLAAHVDQAEAILALLRLQQRFGFNLIIVGGQEAGLVVAEIAAARASVVLSPPRCPPQAVFSSNLCTDSRVKTLVDAGVKVALGSWDMVNSRHLRWEAGWAMGLTFAQALQTVTSNPADIFGLSWGRIQLGNRANFLLFDGDPLTTIGRLQLIALGQQVVCHPKQPMSY